MDKEILGMLNEIRPEFDFTDSEDFVIDGLLDSFDIVSLVSMLEERYAIKIDGLEIVPENFASIKKMISLVEKSTGAK